MALQPATPRTTRAGDLLLHPVAVLAVVVLVVNDHVLKSLAPGLLTGKLSDVAGLLFFPLLLTSVVELGALALHRRPPDRRRVAIGSIVATGLGFFLVKTTVTGSMAFGWAMGAGQWLAGMGPLREVGPLPIAVATDPGDLIALTALIGAWFVARGGAAGEHVTMTQQRIAARRLPSRPAVLMLVVASLATVGSGGSVQQYSSVTWQEPIHLDAAHTTATRHLSYEVDTREYFVQSVALAPEIDPGVLWSAAKPGMTLTLVPDEPSSGTQAGDLTASCIPSCHGGATIIARLTGDAPEGLDLTLHGELRAFGAYDAGATAKFEPSLALRNDDARSFNGNPTMQVARTQGTFHVTTTDPKAKQRLVIRLDAGALAAPLAYPLVATVEVYYQTTKMDHSDVPPSNLKIGNLDIGLGTGLPYLSMDVLPMCKAGHPCEIPVVIRSEYSPHLTVMNPPSASHIGSADLVWRIRVRLEAFDGRTLPADAVSITKQ